MVIFPNEFSDSGRSESKSVKEIKNFYKLSMEGYKEKVNKIEFEMKDLCDYTLVIHISIDGRSLESSSSLY